MTIREAKRELVQRLSPEVGEAEARDMARIILEDTLGCTQLDLVVNDHRELTEDSVARLLKVEHRVLEGEPVQYVLGEAEFRGRRFIVRPGVLIPRPETAELVDMIVRDAGDRSDLRVLDIGTGSGCIAISLARDLRFPSVTAIDISDSALAVVAENAKSLKVRLKLLKADILKDGSVDGQFDIIVSNPPYVMESERKDMDRRVTDHEPSEALFVPNSDPLLFYRAIAHAGKRLLSDDGRLYFEINPRCSDDLCMMLSDMGYRDVEAHRDYLGAWRFISCNAPC